MLFHVFLLDNSGTGSLHEWVFARFVMFGGILGLDRGIGGDLVRNLSFYEFMWLNELVLWISESIKVSGEFRF